MKIAILGIKGVPGHHGVEVVVDSLLPYLVSFGHDITVYGYSSYTENMDDYHGARVRVVEGSSNKNLEMFTHMWNASMDVRRERFDIVHIHSTDPCILAWLPRPVVGLVATSHGQAYIRKKWGFVARTMSKVAERFFIHLPDVRTCVSRPLCDYYEKRYRKDVLYIPNGISFRDAPDPGILGKWGIEPGRYLFCSAGRIEKTKGLSTLMKAYSMAGIEWPLVIAGGGAGSDEAYLAQLKREAPVGVKFVGFLTGDDLFALYAHAGIFIFPSEYEAMSMALLEGLSFGVPTIFSDIPENIAVAEGLGYKFRVADAESLAAVIKEVMSSMDKARSLGQRARETIRKRHDWGEIAGLYNEIYLELERRGRR